MKHYQLLFLIAFLTSSFLFAQDEPALTERAGESEHQVEDGFSTLQQSQSDFSPMMMSKPGEKEEQKPSEEQRNSRDGQRSERDARAGAAVDQRGNVLFAIAEDAEEDRKSVV